MTSDLMFTRSMPDNLDAERFALGAALTDPEAWPQIREILNPEDFALEKHRRIARCIDDVYENGRSINCFNVGTELYKHGQLDSVDGATYLSSLSEYLPKILGLANYCEAIADAAIRRRGIQQAIGFIERCYDPGSDTNDLRGEIERLSESLGTPGKKLADRTVADVIADEGGPNAFLSPEQQPGVELPIAPINLTVNGLRKGKFFIWGAWPAVGKTALAWQCAVHAALNGHRVLFVSLEMGAADLLHRSIAGRSQVNAYKFRRGRLEPSERNALQCELTTLVDLEDRLRILDRADTTVQGILGLLRSHRSRGVPIDLVFIDYLQLLGCIGRFDSRVQEVSTISRYCKRIAQEFRIPLVALSQLTRPKDLAVEPKLFWLKESGQLEQDADTVMFLWSDSEPKQSENVRTVNWKIAKNRDGRINRGKLTFYAHHCHFVDSDEAHAA